MPHCRSAHVLAPAAMRRRQTMDETQRVTGTRRAGRGRGGGGSDRTRSIRRRQPARAAPQRRRTRSATSRRVRQQGGVGAGRPRNVDRLRAPRDRRPRRRRRRPSPSPGRRSRRASHGYAVRASCARVLSGPSVSTLAEITPGLQGPPQIRNTHLGRGPRPSHERSGIDGHREHVEVLELLVLHLLRHVAEDARQPRTLNSHGDGQETGGATGVHRCREYL